MLTIIVLMLAIIVMMLAIIVMMLAIIVMMLTTVCIIAWVYLALHPDLPHDLPHTFPYDGPPSFRRHRWLKLTYATFTSGGQLVTFGLSNHNFFEFVSSDSRIASRQSVFKRQR